MDNERIRVLLVGTDPAEALRIREMLTCDHSPVFAAEHARHLEDALDLLKDHDFDCILVDLGLPGIQGLETALALRDRAKLAAVVIMTTLDDEALALEALGLGIQDCLVKGEITGAMLRRSIRCAILRKGITEELRKSEERFTSFMLHMPVAAWMKDMEGRYVYANAAAEKVFSMPLAELLGKTDRDILAPETARRLGENDCRAFAAGGALQTTEVIRQADGIEHHSIVNKFVVNAPHGEPAYVAGIALDITELLRAEAALRESEEKFSKIFDMVPVGITMSTLGDGRFVGINREGERLSGYRREEVVGHSALEFDIWKDPAERERIIGQVLKEGAVRDREMTFRTKGGAVLHGLFSALVVDIGGEQHLLSIVTDITERKHAEETLRLSEARFRILYRDNPTMIATLDAGLTILSVNPYCAGQLGYAPEELEGRSVLTIFHEDDRPAVAEQLRKCLQRPNHVHNWRFRKLRKDGELLWVEEIAQAVYDLNGAPNILVVCQDITERKEAEEEIARLNADLAARAAELEDANRELQAFNYTVAHDLRQPLNIVTSYCQVIRELCGTKLSDPCRDYLRETYQGALRMNDLIDVLLEFSNISRAELHCEAVDLSAMAREVAGQLGRGAPERRGTFRVAEGVTVHGDPKLLRVVLDNLLGNAWKYTGQREDAVVEFGAREVGGAMACFVSDNGAGFDMADAERLFVPFERLPGSDDFKGFGIGLATVERIVKRHGGKVWAEGAPEKGATFYFLLPGEASHDQG